jgi:RNA recognition motif-containing protein
MTSLFLSNVPHDCEDAELRRWIESRGIPVYSIRIVRDLVAGVSPAFGYIALQDGAQEFEAIRVLDGQDLKGRALRVKPDWRKVTKT